MRMRALLLFALALCGLAVVAALPWSDTLLYSSLSIASSVYCNAAQLSDWSCKPCASVGLSEVTVVSNSTYDVQGLVGYSSDLDAVVIAFRGTVPSDIKNWLQDLKAEQTDWFCQWDECEGARVHKGIFECYASVADDVRPLVMGTLARHPQASVLFVGHSLGSAITVLMAMDMLDAGLDSERTTIFTVGEPRVGNQNFSQVMNQHAGTVYRLINHRDLIPHVPERWMNYHHEVQEVWIYSTPDNANTLKFCDKTNGEDPTCSDSMIALSSHDHFYYLNTTLLPSACN